MNCNSEVIQQLNNIDWSFPGLGNNGIHSFHWYPATYLSAIPGTLIPLFSQEGETVLDPFCGSGTSGVEAIRLGRTFIGMDTNPVALLISNAKVRFPEPAAFLEHVNYIVRESEGLFAQSNIPDHPRQEELLGWYHPNTLLGLNGILSLILNVKDSSIQMVLLAVFSGILKNCSSQGKHWGWVCDNVKPKPFEITNKDAVVAFSNAANFYIESSARLYEATNIYIDIPRSELSVRADLRQGSCIKNMELMADDSVDFIVTSPPYYGVADYVKSQRLSYLWFDRDELAEHMLGFRDFERLRATETGARSNRSRATSHSSYIDFMRTFFTQSNRLLRPERHIALVVGESKARTSTTDFLVQIAEESGFDLVSRSERDIKLSRRRLMAKVSNEDVLIFKKNN